LRRRHPYNVSQTGFSRGILESMPFIVRMGANAIAILLIACLLPTVMSADGPMAALAVAFVVINGLLLWLVSAIVPDLHVNGFPRRKFLFSLPNQEGTSLRLAANPNSTHTSGVEVKGEDGRSPVPGRLPAVRKSLEMDRGRSGRKAVETARGVSGTFAPADVVFESCG